MKRNFIAKISLVILTLSVAVAACREKPPHQHQEMTVDSATAVLSRPVNTTVISGIAAISPESGTRIYSVPLNGIVTYDTRKKTTVSSRVAGRIERLNIKYNFQPVKKGELIMEIYSPDLAAAQRELLLISRSTDAENMLARAKQRLQLLGMQPAQIEQVITSGNILYRVPVYSKASGYILEQNSSPASGNIAGAASTAASPSSGGMSDMASAASSVPVQPAMSGTANSPVLLREGQYVSAGQSLFTIYREGDLIAEFALWPQVAAEVKKGQRLLFYPGSQKEKMVPGTIGLLEPVIKSGQSFSIARVYLTKTELKPGQLLVGYLPVIFRRDLWVPKQAVLQLGARSVVFKKENNVYTPVNVEVGAQIQDMIQIMTNISDWQIASNAYYLVDSESFIKTNGVQQ